MAKIGFPNIFAILSLIVLSEGAIIYDFSQPIYRGYRNRFRWYFYVPYADVNFIAPIQQSAQNLQPVPANTMVNQTAKPDNQTKGINDNKTDLVFGQKDIVVSP